MYDAIVLVHQTTEMRLAVLVDSFEFLDRIFP